MCQSMPHYYLDLLYREEYGVCRQALRHAQSYSNAADVGLPVHLQGTSTVLKAICTLFGRPLRIDKEGVGCGGAKSGSCSSRPGEPRCAQDVAADRQRHMDKLDSFKVHYHMHVRTCDQTYCYHVFLLLNFECFYTVGCCSNVSRLQLFEVLMLSDVYRPVHRYLMRHVK